MSLYASCMSIEFAKWHPQPFKLDLCGTHCAHSVVAVLLASYFISFLLERECLEHSKGIQCFLCQAWTTAREKKENDQAQKRVTDAKPTDGGHWAQRKVRTTTPVLSSFKKLLVKPRLSLLALNTQRRCLLLSSLISSIYAPRLETREWL